MGDVSKADRGVHKHKIPTKKKPRLVWQPKRGFFFGFLGFWILGFYNVPHKWQKEDKINNTKKVMS